MSDLAKRAGIVRTTNPAALLNGQHAYAAFDKLGRQIIVPYQVRDLVGTAAATLTNNAADNETTLIAGVASEYHDLIYVSGANTSDKAIRLVFRETTAGTDLFNLAIPASDTRELWFQVPWNQQHLAGTWVVDFDTNANITNPNDVTNTTVKVSAQFIKNV